MAIEDNFVKEQVKIIDEILLQILLCVVGKVVATVTIILTDR